MKGTLDRTGIYKVDHRTFGGEITPFDFDGHNTMVTMAGKIRQCRNFDRQCRKNMEVRDNTKTYGKQEAIPCRK